LHTGVTIFKNSIKHQYCQMTSLHCTLNCDSVQLHTSYFGK